MIRSTVRCVLVIAMATLVLSACDKSSADSSKDNGNTTNNKPNPNPNPNPNPDPIGDDPGAGPDDDAKEVKAGAAQGSWNIRTTDAEDLLLMSLDLFHDDGVAELTGNYVIFNVSDELKDTNGEIIDGTYTDKNLVVHFNPTADSEEVWTLTATMGDDKTMTGKLANKSGDLTWDVAIGPVPGSVN